jgi:hypothetical protein
VAGWPADPLGTAARAANFCRASKPPVFNKEINAGLADPKIKARMSELGPVLSGSPADFGKLIVEETEKWGKVVKLANIKPD